MISTSWNVFFLGMITFFSGIAGYQMEGSLISLVAGLLLATLLFIGTYLLRNNDEQGLWLSGAVTALLLIQFVPPFLKVGKIFPAGMITIVSLWVGGSLIYGWIQPNYSSH